MKVEVSGEVLVPLQNFRRDDAKLDEGTELGCVEPFGSVVESLSHGMDLFGSSVRPCGRAVESGCVMAPVCGSEDSCLAVSGCQDRGLPSQVLAVSYSPAGESRGSRLLEKLVLPRESLGLDEVQQLEELLLEAKDVFALDDSELGCTPLVQHKVDTGDHPAIKQIP